MHPLVKPKALLHLLLASLLALFLLNYLLTMVWIDSAQAAAPSSHQANPALLNEQSAQIQPITMDKTSSNLVSQQIKPGEVPQGLPPNAWTQMLDTYGTRS